MRIIATIDEARECVSEISARGLMPLFHGAREDFDVLEIDPSRSRGFGNCSLGLHVTSDPYLAYDYVGDRGGIVVLAVPPGRFGIVDHRNLYINMDRDAMAGVIDENPGLLGVVADDLGDDLSGAGIVFDISLVEVCGRIPPQVACSDLFRDGDDEAELVLAINRSGSWPGAEWVGLDLHHLEQAYGSDPDL